jgi:hypothetical protein
MLKKRLMEQRSLVDLKEILIANLMAKVEEKLLLKNLLEEKINHLNQKYQPSHHLV